MGHREHTADAPSSLTVAVLTVSDTRSEETDDTGRAVCDRLRGAGHRVAEYRLVPDAAASIASVVAGWIENERIQVVITTGGTGLSPRDVTPEALTPLLDKVLHGFGELFRFLSFEEIGAAAFLSRAFAGLAGGTLLFCLPGSTAGALLALDRLILSQMGHGWAMAHPGVTP